MTSDPNSSDDGPPDLGREHDRFLRNYGGLIARWGLFELIIEVKIAKLAGLAPKDASIILGGLSFGNKPSILFSLLESRGDDAVIPTVKAVINHAKRNALVHGLLGRGDNDGEYAFFKREVKDRMVVQHHTFTDETFKAHFEEFERLLTQAMQALGVFGNDIEEYGYEAGLYEPTPPRPPAHRRGEARHNR